ncbi:MAG: PIG-L family deacetylase [Anaerolineae bacterium]|nr:PIG-L family deacetylase [Anaerolineae bacterium]
MSKPYSHIYISPHLDDAVCSCGGLIKSQTARGERVLVLTLFTAGIEDENELPPYLRALHLVWGFGTTEGLNDPFAARRQEDLAALDMLGAAHQHIGWRGALYRQASDGRFLYSGLSYFGPPVKEDQRLLARIRRLMLSLRQQYPEAILYAPLGVGGHVDHRLTHQAARYVPGPMRFYEDVPYVFMGKVAPVIMNLMALSARIGWRGSQYSGGGRINGWISAVQSRTSLFGGPQLSLWSNRRLGSGHWQPLAYPIDLPAKFDAMVQYASQIPMLFGSPQWAWQSLETYATSIEKNAHLPHERQWALQTRDF